MYYYIYQITNLINNKIYVGKHKSVKHPLENSYYGSGKQIIAAIKKYGLENFKKEILHYCNDINELALKEENIVTEEFIQRTDTYNMHKGGFGGFEHINLDPEKRKEINKQTSIRNKKLGLGGTKHWTDDSRKRIKEAGKKSQPAAVEKARSPESIAKRKKTFEKIKHGQGSRNSQYGKIWISNVLTKEVKRISITDTIPIGWARGKKGYIQKMCWINNGKVEKFIPLEKQKDYINIGYKSGRFITSLPQNRIVV